MDSFEIVGGIVGPMAIAVFTAFVANGLTRLWIDRKESRSIKTQLVSEMSETASTAFLAGQRAFGHTVAAETQTVSETPETTEAPKAETALKKAARNWERDNAVIGTKLESYFGSSSADHEFAADVKYTAELTKVAVKAAESYDIPVAWHGLGSALEGWLGGMRNDHENWLEEEKKLKQAKAKLIRRVLDEPMIGFKETFWRRPRASAAT